MNCQCQYIYLWKWFRKIIWGGWEKFLSEVMSNNTFYPIVSYPNRLNMTTVTLSQDVWQQSWRLSESLEGRYLDSAKLSLHLQESTAQPSSSVCVLAARLWHLVDISVFTFTVGSVTPISVPNFFFTKHILTLSAYFVITMYIKLIRIICLCYFKLKE